MERSRSDTLRCTCPILASADMDPPLMLALPCYPVEPPSGYYLHRAREAGAERLLGHHVQEPEALQVPRPLQRPHVYGPQAPVARDLGHYLLGPLLVPRDKDFERLAGDLPLHERPRERGVEGLNDPRPRRYHRRELLRRRRARLGRG